MTAASDLTGVILAGGESRRMGTDKAFFEVDGVPMITRVVETLRQTCLEVVVVAKAACAYSGLGARVVIDAEPFQAPLVGVCSGLRAVLTPWAFVAACDLPYLAPEAVRLLARLARGHDAAVPLVGGLWHPLHAIYSAGSVSVLEARLAQGTRRMVSALEALRVRPVGEEELARADPSLRTLCNVNTPRAGQRQGQAASPWK